MFDFMYFDTFFSKDKNRLKINKTWNARLIFYRLLSIVMGRFKYTLPDTMDARFLELSLIQTGYAGVAKIGEDIMNLQVIAGSSFSPYGYLVNYDLVDYMGRDYGRFVPDTPGQKDIADSVFIMDNPRNVPPIFRIKWYAERLCAIQTSIDAAIKNLRAGCVVVCPKEQEGPVKRAFSAIDDGAAIVLSYNENNAFIDPPKILTNPQTPEVLKTLLEAYDKTLANFLTEFGINSNAVINKLSGVSDNELLQNEEATDISLQQALECRRDGLERVEKMFGVPCSVEINYYNILSTAPIGADVDKKEERNDA